MRFATVLVRRPVCLRLENSLPVFLVCLKCCFALLLLCSPLVGRGQVISGTLPVTAPGAVAVNTVTNKIYVASGSAVLAVDGKTHAITSIPVDSAPAALAVDASANKVYSANSGGTVTVIDGTDNSATSLTVGKLPMTLAVNPDTGTAYVANLGSNTVSVIHGGAITATVNTGKLPSAIAVNPVTNRIYVVNNDDGTVTVIDGATNSATSIPAVNQGAFIAVNSATNRIYVSGNGLAVIDGNTNAVLTTLTFQAGSGNVAVNTVTNTIYDSSQETITAIDGSTNATTTITLTGGTSTGNSLGLTVDSVTNQVYAVYSSIQPPHAAHGNGAVVVIDGATNGQTILPAGVDPSGGLAVNPVTNTVYAANGASGLLVIAGAKVSTSVALSADTNPQTANGKVTFTARLGGTAAPGTATGSVVFSDGPTMLGTQPLGVVQGSDQASLQTSFTASGVHTIKAVYSGDASFTGSTGTLNQTVSGGTTPATVTLGNLSQVYNTHFHGASVVTNPAGLAVSVTYDGSTREAVTVGNHTVVATIADPKYSGSATGVLTITKAVAPVMLGALVANGDGQPHGATATTVPAGLSVGFTYNGSATPPSAPGKYTVVATVSDPSYTGTATGTLTLKAPATVTLGNLSQAYNGHFHSASVVTSPAGLAVNVTYDGISTQAMAVGTHTVVATINDPNYFGSATGTLTITKGVVTVTVGNQTVNAMPFYNQFANVTTSVPVTGSILITYNGSTTEPMDPGKYTVIATVQDPNYTGTGTGTLTVRAQAFVSFSNLVQPYTGHFHAVGTTTSPAGLAVSVTYNGVPTQAMAPGTYKVIATINDPNYFGTATATLTITSTEPQISVPDSETGTYAENAYSITLPQAPAQPVTVTISSGGPEMLLSKDRLTVGTPTITYANVTSTNVGTIFLQGKTEGTPTITVSAPGYASGTGTVTVYETALSFPNGSSDSFANLGSGPAYIPVGLTTANPFAFRTGDFPALYLSPGLGPIRVMVTSGDSSVGTISTAILTFNTGDSFQPEYFQPLSEGDSELTIESLDFPFSTEGEDIEVF